MNPAEGVVSKVPRNSFPNKMALRGAEGARLHDASSLIQDLKNAGEWEAKKHPYPGNGKMSAEDTKELLDSVRGPLAIIAASKKSEFEMGEQEMALSKKNTDALIGASLIPVLLCSCDVAISLSLTLLFATQRASRGGPRVRGSSLARSPSSSAL
jgi:hypothetical protein